MCPQEITDPRPAELVKLDQTIISDGRGVNVRSRVYAPDRRLPILVWLVSVCSFGSSLPFAYSQRTQTVRVHYVLASFASRSFRFVWPWV